MTCRGVSLRDMVVDPSKFDVCPSGRQDMNTKMRGGFPNTTELVSHYAQVQVCHDDLDGPNMVFQTGKSWVAAMHFPLGPCAAILFPLSV